MKYQTNVCVGRLQRSVLKLQLHMKYHRDERDEQCPLCEKAFHEHKTLKTHLLKIHNVFNMRGTLSSVQRSCDVGIVFVLKVYFIYIH